VSWTRVFCWIALSPDPAHLTPVQFDLFVLSSWFGGAQCLDVITPRQIEQLHSTPIPLRPARVAGKGLLKFRIGPSIGCDVFTIRELDTHSSL